MTPERQAAVEALVNLLNQKEYPDSVELGTPARGGAIKCYGNADDPEGFQRRIDAMKKLLEDNKPALAPAKE